MPTVAAERTVLVSRLRSAERFDVGAATDGTENARA